MDLSNDIFKITNYFGNLILFFDQKIPMNQSDFCFFILARTYKFLNFLIQIIIVLINSTSILFKLIASFFARLNLNISCIISQFNFLFLLSWSRHLSFLILLLFFYLTSTGSHFIIIIYKFEFFEF